jgi:hypothetical protein
MLGAQKRETSMISTSYVHLGHGVSARRDAHRHPPHGEILRGQLDEVQGDSVSPRLPGPNSPRVHRGRQRRLDREAIAALFRFSEPTQNLTPRRHRMREGCTFGLDLVDVQECDVWIQRR